MKNIISALFLGLLTQQVSAQTYYCGTFRVLPSCGAWTVIVPLIETDFGTVGLDTSCGPNEPYVCSLRSSLVRMMKEGSNYCVQGTRVREYQSPCVDSSVHIYGVSATQN